MESVYVEFFSSEALENVMVLLKYKPDLIIYIGHKHDMITKKIESLKKFKDRISPDTELKFIEVPRDDFDFCVNTLNNIADKYPSAQFELSGGGELILMAFGFVSATRKLTTLRIDPFTNVEIRMNDGGKPSRTYFPVNITVADNMVLHGGSLTPLTGTTSTWKFSDDFREDVRAIWKVSCSLRARWTKYCSVIEECIKSNQPDDTGLYILPKSGLGDSIEVFERLNRINVLKDFSHRNKSIAFRFKNDMIRHIITKTGNILELHVYEVATRSKNFNDAVIGAVIDWDGKTYTYDESGNISLVNYKGSDRGYNYTSNYYQSVDTINEIDVILMRGVLPTFISCKSGRAGSSALHELQTITRRFGGNYAKKILIMACPVDKSPSGTSYFKQRAKDMHIWVIDDVYSLSDEALLSKLIRIQGS